MRWRKWTKFPAVLWSSSFSRQCSARVSAMKVWYIIENRACPAIVHSFSKPRKTYECIYTNTFTSKLSRGLDKPSQKLLGQDKPRLGLAVGWISREHRFCTIYTGCSRLMQASARESRGLCENLQQGKLNKNALCYWVAYGKPIKFSVASRLRPKEKNDGRITQTIHISMTNTFHCEYCQCFTFKRGDKFKRKCTSHGGMYSAHYFWKISITSKQRMLYCRLLTGS